MNIFIIVWRSTMEGCASEHTKVKFNIGGKIFITTSETLSKIPGSRLAELQQDDPSYDPEVKEYYYDRNHALFHAILDTYRTGEFHFPHCFCGPFVRQELEFWRIPENYIGQCCQRSYGQFEEEQKQISRLKKIFHQAKYCTQTPASVDQRKDICGRILRWKWVIWRLLENPSSSLPAKVWGFTFLVVIVTSITILVMSTDPSFRFLLDEPLRNLSGIKNPKVIMYLATSPHTPVLILDNICFCIFVVELLLRFLVCPRKLAFFKGFYNIVDILCVIPMGVIVIMDSFFPYFWTDDTLFDLYSSLSILSVFRVLRLLKFARQFTGVQVLLLSIRSSIRELLLLLLLMMMGILVFSCMIYFAEFYQDDNFHNIPIGFWWSIVTMTTVGYGDKHPKSGWGYLVGAVCALCGMLSTGLPIPIIANNFNFYYSFAKSQECLERRRAKRQKTLLSIDEDGTNSTHHRQSARTSSCEQDVTQDNRENQGASDVTIKSESDVQNYIYENTATTVDDIT